MVLSISTLTRAKVGTDGVEANLLGFGLTMGVGGKWTINTPFGSVGGCSANTSTNTNANTNRRTNANVYTN